VTEYSLYLRRGQRSNDPRRSSNALQKVNVFIKLLIDDLTSEIEIYNTVNFEYKDFIGIFGYIVCVHELYI